MFSFSFFMSTNTGTDMQEHNHMPNSKVLYLNAHKCTENYTLNLKPLCVGLEQLEQNHWGHEGFLPQTNSNLPQPFEKNMNGNYLISISDIKGCVVVDK